ncbi:MAG: phosphatase PAP2 family protein [Bryobacteraceae bacterium]|nr:phosphatase PAP2 family protein [Bryobacteraceae bacterium]
MLEFIASRDHRLMRRVNSWRAPRWVRLWMVCATRGGDGWLWYTMLFVILVFGGDSRFAAIAACATAAALGTVIFLFLKRKTGRRRPCAIAEHCWARLLPPDQFSFPSGHSITACAIGVPLSLFYPSLAVGLFFCGFSIALSRVLLGMHFLSDVVVGCMMGALLGYSCYLIYI